MPLTRKAAFASSTFALLLFTLLLFPAEARADVIQITSGHVFIGGAPLSRNAWRAINFNFSGNNFNAAGGTGDGEGRQQVQSPCGGALLCQPGTSVTPNSTAFLQMFGVATFNGTTVGSWWVGSGSTLNFTGPDVVIPDAAGQSFTLTTPFAMTGSVFVHSLDDINHPLVFSTDVSGQGIATLTFSYFNFTPTTNGYVLSSIRYDFTPIPEPATMILLGTGLAGIAARRYKRRQARNKSDN